MKRSILIVVLIGFLPQLPWIKKLKQKIIFKLKQQYKINFHLAKCRFKSPSVLSVYEIGFSNSKIKFDAQEVEVKLHLKNCFKFISGMLVGSKSIRRISAPYFTLANINHLLNTLPFRHCRCQVANLAFNKLRDTSRSDEDNLELKLNTFFFGAQKATEQHVQYPFNIKLTFEKLLFNYKALAANESMVDYFELDIVSKFDEQTFIISDDSSGKFNLIPFNLYVDYRNMDPDHVHFAIEIPCTLVDDVLISFPHLINKDLFQIKAEGSLGLWAIMKWNIHKPLSRYFDASLERHNFKIIDAPVSLVSLNSPFMHTVFPSDKYERNILIAEENKNFAPLRSISPNMANAIVCTEDPLFYSHKGIDVYLLGHSLAMNIANKKFLRGGSTITMQLVRNLFLSHNKNIYRKIEELMLTWMIEEISGLSKERILEIYLNIIEWGPDIYGIKEASEFYFSKDPGKLNLTESLVLSYIVPRPKYFLDAVKSSSPRLKNNLKNHLKNYSSIMLQNGIVTQKDVDEMNYKIKLANKLGDIDLTVYAG